MTDEEVILAALKEDPSRAPVFADWYEERGLDADAKRLRELPHIWEDQSYHGSAEWECVFCKAEQWCKPPPVCPKGVEGFIKYRTVAIEEEKREHSKLKHMFDRWKYLSGLYGE